MCYPSAGLDRGVEFHSLRLDFGNPATAFCPLSSVFLFLYLKPLLEKQLCSRENQPHFPNKKKKRKKKEFCLVTNFSVKYLNILKSKLKFVWKVLFYPAQFCIPSWIRNRLVLQKSVNMCPEDILQEGKNPTQQQNPVPINMQRWQQCWMKEMNMCSHFLFLSPSRKCSFDGKENYFEVFLRFFIIVYFQSTSLLKSTYHKHLVSVFPPLNAKAQMNDLFACFTERQITKLISLSSVL